MHGFFVGCVHYNDLSLVMLNLVLKFMEPSINKNFTFGFAIQQAGPIVYMHLSLPYVKAQSTHDFM